MGEFDFKERAREILDYLSEYPIDGDPDIPYHGPEQPGEVLQRQTLECLERLARDNTTDSNELAVSILDAVNAGQDSSFYQAVAKGAGITGNSHLATMALKTVQQVEDEISSFMEAAAAGEYDEYLDDGDSFDGPDDGGLVVH